jgi:hypothetical protein
VVELYFLGLGKENFPEKINLGPVTDGWLLQYLLELALNHAHD